MSTRTLTFGLRAAWILSAVALAAPPAPALAFELELPAKPAVRPEAAPGELSGAASAAIRKFLLTETPAGAAILRRALGAAVAPGAGDEALSAALGRLREGRLRPIGDALEARLLEIESAFTRRYLARVRRPGALGAKEKAFLAALSRDRLSIDDALFLQAADAPAASGARAAFLAPVAPAPRYPHGVDPAAHPDWRLTFGFESEYTMKDLAKLVDYYGPAPELGVSAAEWRAMATDARVAWIKENARRLFPTARSPGGLVKQTDDPALAFLPERLIQDSTGNVEIILAPVATFEEWRANVTLLNERLGTGSMQGTVGLPAVAFFGAEGAVGAETMARRNLGFLSFMSDFDTLQKLELGAVRYAKDATKAAANSFNHPFLGPMTRLKAERLAEFVEANAAGRLTSPDDLAFVSGRDSSFKYFGGTAYRPDIVPGLTILEVRDAHTNMEALVDRLSRAIHFLQTDRAIFEGAARLGSFDSVAEFERLPSGVQAMLQRVFPQKTLPGVAYAADEVTANQVFRNFAYPLRDWSAQLGFIGRLDLATRVQFAQGAYVQKLAAVAADLEAGRITVEQASLSIQGAVATFAVESRLSEAYRLWLKPAAPAAELRQAS